MTWKSLLPKFGTKDPLPSIDPTDTGTKEDRVHYLEDRFLLWTDEKGLATKIDMSQCVAIAHNYGTLYVLIGNEKFYPPLTFEQADYYWNAARHNYYLPA